MERWTKGDKVKIRNKMKKNQTIQDPIVYKNITLKKGKKRQKNVHNGLKGEKKILYIVVLLCFKNS